MLRFEDCICVLWWWMAEKKRFSNVYFYFFVSCLWFVWWKNCLNSDNQRCVLPLSHNFFCHIGWKDIKSCAALLFQAQNISIVNHCGRSSKAKWAAWIFHEIHRNSFFLSGTCALNFLKSDGPIQFTKENRPLPISLLEARWSSNYGKYINLLMVMVVHSESGAKFAMQWKPMRLVVCIWYSVFWINELYFVVCNSGPCNKHRSVCTGAEICSFYFLV